MKKIRSMTNAITVITVSMLMEIFRMNNEDYHEWISVSQPTWEAIQYMIKDVLRQERKTTFRNMSKEQKVVDHIQKKLLEKWETI